MSERLKPGMSEMMERVVAQTEHKKLWVDNDSPEEIARMISEEAQELQDAIQDSLLSGDVFSIASEVGDILYLALKFCHSVGLKPEDTVELKILRNDLKYPNDLNSYGEYGQRRKQSKDMWQAMGGDVAFSHAYLDIFSNLEDEIVEDEHVNPFALALSNGHHNGNGHLHKENVFEMPILAVAGD